MAQTLLSLRIISAIVHVLSDDLNQVFLFKTDIDFIAVKSEPSTTSVPLEFALRLRKNFF